MEPRACPPPKPATFLHPESQEIGGVGVQGGAYPDHSRQSENSGGKIFQRAMKSKPAPNNMWSLG